MIDTDGNRAHTVNNSNVGLKQPTTNESMTYMTFCGVAFWLDTHFT